MSGDSDGGQPDGMVSLWHSLVDGSNSWWSDAANPQPAWYIGFGEQP